MKRRILLLLFSAAPALFAADALPLAESLLDRYVEVTGGRQAYENRKTEFARGTMEYKAQGLKGAITRWSDASGNYYSSLDVAGIGAIEMGVRGGVAWERSDVLGPRIKEGVERAEAIREATLNSTYRWRELFPKVETTGTEVVEGQDCYRVVMTPAEGAPETIFLSKETGLAVKMVTISSTQMGNVPVEVLVRDYRDFGGIKAPATIVQSAAGLEFTLTLETVEVNAPIPPGRFDLPADVQALLAKRAAR
jgi:hypothetical protein